MSRARSVTLEGMKELQAMTSTLAPRAARNLARSTTHYIAGQLRNAMRKRAPKASGNLRRAIVAKRRSMRGDQAVSDVRIEHGAGAKNDAWYWHFKEFGTQHLAAEPYIRPSVEEFIPQGAAVYRKEFGKRLEKQLARDAIKQGVRKRG